MKPFNLEEALAGKPIIARNGNKVTNFCYFKEAIGCDSYPVYAHVEGSRYINSWNIHGQLHPDIKHDWDLMMVEEKKRVPLTAEDLPSSGAIWIKREKDTDWYLISSICSKGIRYPYDAYISNLSYQDAFESGWVWAIDRNNPQPFYKEV